LDLIVVLCHSMACLGLWFICFSARSRLTYFSPFSYDSRFRSDGKNWVWIVNLVICNCNSGCFFCSVLYLAINPWHCFCSLMIGGSNQHLLLLTGLQLMDKMLLLGIITSSNFLHFMIKSSCEQDLCALFLVWLIFFTTFMSIRKITFGSHGIHLRMWWRDLRWYPSI